MSSPQGVSIDAFNAPWLQLRWTRTGVPPDHDLPYVEWMRAEDEQFSEQRRVYFEPPGPDVNPPSGTSHTLIRMHDHPLWQGSIARLRLHLAVHDREDVGRPIRSKFFAGANGGAPVVFLQPFY